jgi:hypothetical protein
MSEPSKKELAKKILALTDEIICLKKTMIEEGWKKRKDHPLFVVIRNQEMLKLVEEYTRANTL